VEQEIDYNIIDHIIKMEGDMLITDDLVFISEFLKSNQWILKTRKRELVYTRRYICFLIKNKIKGGKESSLSKIGELLGGINHATVIHHLNEHKDQIETKDYLYRTIMEDTDKLISQFKRHHHRIN